MSRTNLLFRSRLLSRVAVVALISGLAAGCSSGIERFGGPIYTGGTQNQKDILTGPLSQPSFDEIMASSGTSPVNAPANGSVTGGLLPPAGGGGVPIVSAQASQPVPLYTGSVGKQTSSVLPPRTQFSENTPIQRGWSTAGGTVVTLGPGESVQSVSRRYGVPVKAIQTANKISGDPAAPMTGQRLIIPTYNRGSPVPSRALAPTARSTAVNALPVRTKTVRVASTAVVIPDAKPRQPRVASLTSSTASRPARVVPLDTSPKRKPAAATPVTRSTKPVTPRVTALPNRRPATTAPIVSQAKTPKAVKPAPVENKISSISPEQEPQTTASINNGVANRFRWPVRGRVISSFGRKAGGTRNDGINLAVPEGAQIRSVESGTVIYAGNELKGYGNLVLIRHEDGWVSAYAHASELKVRRGDTVRRGDIVANAGSTGSVSQPQLHFELRRGNKPVDPLQYLSKV